MRKTIMAGLMAVTLNACATMPNPPTLQEIQSATALACGFVPTAISVTEMVAPSTSPYAATAEAIAYAICDAVAKIPPTARRRTTPTISVRVVLPNGTVAIVKGHYTKARGHRR
jgi:hypothetical protein